MKWKVCGLREKINIREVVALQPHYLGFIFYPQSPRYVGADWEGPGEIPKQIAKVGVFVNETMDQIIALAQAYDLDLLQLHGEETVSYCKSLANQGYNLIKVISVDRKQDLESYEPYKPWVKYFLFDTKSPQYGGTGTSFDWGILKLYDNEVPLILSGGISLTDIAHIKRLDHLNLAFVDVNSRFELEPGLKDIKLLGSLKKKIEKT